MLKLALAVVDAARELRLESRDGKTRPTVEGYALNGILEELRSAIEAFDAGGAREDFLVKPTPLNRPDFAVPPQLSDDGFEPESEDAYSPEFRHEPDAEHKSDEELDTELALSLVAGYGKRPGRSPSPERSNDPRPQSDFPSDPRPHLKIGEGEFFPVEASDDEILESIEVLSDKLGYAVKKVGWTPRLKKLAMAARVALSKVAPVSDRYESKYVVMPREEFMEFTLKMTEAVIDMDVKLPSPKHSFRKDLEDDAAPVPRP